MPTPGNGPRKKGKETTPQAGARQLGEGAGWGHGADTGCSGVHTGRGRSLGMGCWQGLHTHGSQKRKGGQELGWAGGPAGSQGPRGRRESRYSRETHLSVPNPWFYSRREKTNKPNHRNSSSTENPHRGERFPHQTSFIGYKYLIIRTRPWNARHFAAFITCVGVFTNDTHIYSYTLTNLI